MLRFSPNRNAQKEITPWTSQKLLFISEVKYLDYEILLLPNNKNIFTPTKKVGYNFYLETKNGEFQVLKVRTVTIYKNNKRVVRCVLDFDEGYTEIDFNNAKTNALYFPSETAPDNTIGIYYEKEENDIYQYNFHFNGHYLGFVSEFGEYERWNENAEGNMFFCFEDCPFLIKSNAAIPIDEYSDTYNKYRKILKDNFPNYGGGLSNFRDSTVVAVAEDNVNNLLVKQWHLFEGYEYYYIKFNNQRVLSATHDPFEIFCINEHDLYKTSDGFIGCRANCFNKRFDPNNKMVGKSVKINRGFNVIDKGYEGEFPDSFFSCLIINDEIKYFHEYNPIT